MIIGIICAVVLFAGIFLLVRIVEKELFNKGMCPRCKKGLRLVQTDNQGDREYTCDNCNYTIWIHYNVDKHFPK